MRKSTRLGKTPQCVKSVTGASIDALLRRLLAIWGSAQACEDVPMGQLVEPEMYANPEELEIMCLNGRENLAGVLSPGVASRRSKG